MLVGADVPVATKILAAKCLRALAQCAQSTSESDAMAPLLDTLWATTHKADNCFECRLGAGDSRIY